MRLIALLVILLGGMAGIDANAVLAQGADEVDVVRLDRALMLGPLGRGGRVAVAPDPVQALIAAGDWSTPDEDDVLVAPDGSERRWTAVDADEAGRFSGRALRGGYVLVRHEQPRERVMLLHGVGHSMVYVNGAPRAGDPYSTGFVRVPVRLRAGENELLFSVSRGRLQATLEEPRSAVMIDTRDRTLPDLIVGEPIDTVAAVIVINATVATRRGLRLVAELGGLGMTSTDLSPVPPLSVRKVAVRIKGRAPTETGTIPLRLELLDVHEPGEQLVLDEAELELAVRGNDELMQRTFVSDIDGSVQYYAVRPAEAGGADPPGLVLSLHGAGVEGRGQAACYVARDWAHVVAPTNRRPFGFDWEDWGRLDALEVLGLAEESLGTDRGRTFLTGHSMGGHGTWNLGVHFPDRFAAIAPSAGWISFWSYTGAAAYEDADPIEQIMKRAASASDTLALSRNYLHQGIYILHGDRDDNVPVARARTMREHLAGFHADFAYYERPGAGHWWGNQCMDWPPLMEFLRRHELPAERDVRRVEFVTASPAVSATCNWATIETQQSPWQTSRVDLELNAEERRFAGTTWNVARLSLDLSALSAPERVMVGEGADRREERRFVLEPGADLVLELDGHSLTVPWPAKGSRVTVRRDGPSWRPAGPPDPMAKSPQRGGSFKDAFRHRFVLVYGTGGDVAENDWSFAKARYDAETFWYRGNGSVDVVADDDFVASADTDRSVILYGNAETNAAWSALLSESPVQVGRDHVTIGDRRLDGEDLGVLLVRPRPGSEVASVAAVAGTGVGGAHLTDRLPYFVSGVGYPDVLVLGPEALERGMDGIRVAGFFGNDWSVEKGDVVFREDGGSDH